MPRLIYPEDFAGQQTLTAAIKTKFDADGASSPLIPFLAKNSIDLDDDATNCINAGKQDSTRSIKNKQSQNYFQLRDLFFEPVLKNMKGEIQFLKAFAKPNYKDLGNWGVTVINTSKIVYPPEFAKLTKLFADIVTQNGSYVLPDVSPLVAYLKKQKIDLTTEASNVALATDDDKKAKDSATASEEATQKRNELQNPINAHNKMMGDFLFKLCKENEKELGEYGFTVYNSVKAPKDRTSTVKPEAQITTSGIVIGSVFTNISTVDLHVYKGKTTTGTPVIVHPAELLSMTKGYSLITVVNPSTLVTAKFKVKVVN